MTKRKGAPGASSRSRKAQVAAPSAAPAAAEAVPAAAAAESAADGGAGAGAGAGAEAGAVEHSVLDSERYAGVQGLVYEESIASSDEAGAHAERQALELPCLARRAKWTPLKYKKPKPPPPGEERRLPAAALEAEVPVPHCQKDRSLQVSLGIDLEGLVVAEVKRDGCADRHGVRKGMTLKALHGVHLSDERDLDSAWADAPAAFRALFKVPGRWCPPPMTSASLVAFPAENKMVLFGGAVDTVPSNNTWIYDHGTQKWDCQYQDKPEGEGEQHRVSPRAEARRRRRRDIGFDPQQKSMWPAPRCGHQAAAVSDHEMIMFGGADISITQTYNDLWYFDLRTYLWNRIDAGGVPPCPRWQFSMVSVEKRVFVHAGESPSYEILGDLHVYDHDPLASIECSIPCPSDGSHSAESWGALLRLRIEADSELQGNGQLGQRGYRLSSVDAAARHAPPAVVLSVTVDAPRSRTDHKLLLEALAGALELSAEQLASHHEGQRRWLRLRTIWPTPPPRMMHAACAVADKMVVVGGVSPQVGQGSSVWLLECRSLVWREIDAKPMIGGSPLPSGGVSGHAGLMGHLRGLRDQLPSADLQVTPFHTPTTHADGKLGTLVGHVCMPYDNLCLVHGGRLDGRLQGDWLWCLDLLTEVWTKLDVQAEAGVKKGDKSVMPSARWKHCCCAHTEQSQTVKMETARKLPEAQPDDIDINTLEPRRKSHDKSKKQPQPDWRDSALYPIHEEDVTRGGPLKKIVDHHRKNLDDQRKAHCEGLLMTQGSTPCVVSTTSCVLWGGGAQVKKTADLWQLTLVDGACRAPDAAPLGGAGDP
eukprot:TRINITY_DN65228_c0_g1_i1.p1 TRINITY_DN65228_c0_g1~~TRINITY_DN65228_c0_g1_i1.p1  ORF type:complete len:819 (+),score=283.33 TRINITY_DN65228_c0_g1_i1:68-2524(+)